MAERITLELSEAVMQAAREEAARTGQTLENVLNKQLEQSYETKRLREILGENPVFEVNLPFTVVKGGEDLMKLLEQAQKNDEESCVVFSIHK